MAKKLIVIIGAGLSGLSAAWHLQRKGVECRVLEQETEVGGLCRSKQIQRFTFDYDGHLLHFRQPYTLRLVKALLKGNLAKHKRSAWIYSASRYIRYPYQANLYGLPASVVGECLLGFIQANKNTHSSKKKYPNFLEWIKFTFGEGIARHFMVPYNSKFWTVNPRELTCEWLDGFIPVPTLSEVVEGTVEENMRLFGYNGWFWYPKKGGIQQLADRFASDIRNIQLSSKVISIDVAKKEIKTSVGERIKYDYLISTMPLPEIAKVAAQLPQVMRGAFDKLRWNSIFNLNLGLNSNGLPKRHWVYFPEKEISFFRVGFYHNFSATAAPKQQASIYAELAYSPRKAISPQKIISSVKNDLNKLGLLSQGKGVCIEDFNDIKYGYPIYDANYSLARGKIVEYLTLNNIIPCGRYGSWKYFSMEDSILDGRRAATIVA